LFPQEPSGVGTLPVYGWDAGGKQEVTGLNIGICGGGVGGQAAAIALNQAGRRPRVFEQATEFARIGANGDTAPAALRQYENARTERTASIQRDSLANEWMREQGNADRVYGYHAWEVAVDYAAGRSR
tara:strand:+ start:3585 stop:3968 length:384 start_codon:yes stop_codon:yes gene_type:complete